MSFPQSVGVFDGYVIFSINGLFYKTTAVSSPPDYNTALALVSSGQAIQQFESYQAQFPWLYETNALVTESGNGGSNGTNLVTENGDELWA